MIDCVRFLLPDTDLDWTVANSVFVSVRSAVRCSAPLAATVGTNLDPPVMEFVMAHVDEALSHSCRVHEGLAVAAVTEHDSLTLRARLLDARVKCGNIVGVLVDVTVKAWPKLVDSERHVG